MIIQPTSSFLEKRIEYGKIHTYVRLPIFIVSMGFGDYTYPFPDITPYVKNVFDEWCDETDEGQYIKIHAYRIEYDSYKDYQTLKSCVEYTAIIREDHAAYYKLKYT